MTLMTPAGRPCEFGVYTGEIYSSNARLFEAGVEVVTNQQVIAVEDGFVRTECSMSGRAGTLDCDVMIPVCRRVPVTDVHAALTELSINDPAGAAASIRSVSRIGDAEAPNTIAAAVYAGYRAGVETGKSVDLAVTFGRREHPGA